MPAVPAFEGEEHVGTHDDADFRVGVFLHQRVHRLGGIALPLALDLHVGDLHPRQIPEGQAAHLQPLLRAGAVLFQLLVGRHIGGNDEKLIRLERLAGGPCGLRVTDMRRVEAAAVNGNPHFFLSFTSSIFGSFSLRL